MQKTDIKAGVYRHYKGAEYWVERVARHSETEEEWVVYQTLYGDYSWWLRPKHVFLEQVTLEGESVPRFAWIRENI